MKLAIKGHETRGKEVIKLLEMLGGKMFSVKEGDQINKKYYISKQGKICCDPINCKSEGHNHIVYSLERFEQDFPFKIGDKVYPNNCLFDIDDTLTLITSPFKVISMEWNEHLDTITCQVKNGHTILVTTIDTLKPYKPMKQKELKDYLKPGYVVEYDDGDKYVVTQDVHGNVFGIQLGKTNQWSPLKILDRIVAVYQINKPTNLHWVDVKSSAVTKVWERKEVELTMQQIADKFGIDVNQLKIKK